MSELRKIFDGIVRAARTSGYYNINTEDYIKIDKALLERGRYREALEEIAEIPIMDSFKSGAIARQALEEGKE